MLYMEAGEWYKTAEGREVNGDRVSRLLVLDSLSLTRLNKLGLVACSPIGFDPCPPELILGLQVRGRRGQMNMGDGGDGAEGEEADVE